MLRELVRVGIVTQTYPDKATVRVQMVDVDDTVSYELPVIMRKTLKDKDYWMPDVGEHVVCLFLGQGLEQGFVLGAIYSEADKVPVIEQNKRHIEFEDGTVIDYDRIAHRLYINCVGEVNIIAAQGVKIQGDINITGNIHATGAIIDEGGNTNHHSH